MPRYTTITSWARLIWKALRTYELDADAIFRQVGLDPEDLNDPGARYPSSCMSRLWVVAAESSGDPCFGLTAAAQWHPTTWHGLGYAWLASTSLEEALHRLVRYSAAISTGGAFGIRELGDRLRLSMEAFVETGAGVHPALMDAAMATVVSMCRMTYGSDFNAIAIDLPHEGVGCQTRRQEFFRTSIRYRAPEIALEIDADMARKPLASANSDLAHANERVIADYLAELGGSRMAMRVKARLIDGLASGSLTERDVADSLHMSLRTLQRRLGAENTSYKIVLDETRRELAERFIADSTLTLNEIAYLLGYSELSSFSRSFKRWTGMPPTEFRRAIDPPGNGDS
jgi:AraC-like DNA-binding protein